MRDTQGQPIWNLYIEPVAGGYRIIMPNTLGVMEHEAPKDGFAMSWPVNPHFTGKEGIAEILQVYDKFAGKNFI